jgi:hypothetical protein
MNFLSIIEAILGEGTQIASMFIHNPKSQQIEAVVVSTAEGIVQGLAGAQSAAAAKAVTPLPATPAA